MCVSNAFRLGCELGLIGTSCALKVGLSVSNAFRLGCELGPEQHARRRYCQTMVSNAFRLGCELGLRCGRDTLRLFRSPMPFGSGVS